MSISLKGTFAAAGPEGKKIVLKAPGADYGSPYKMSEFFDMEHTSAGLAPEGFCVLAEKVETNKIKVTITSDLLSTEEYLWGYTILKDTCEVAVPEVKTEWSGGVLVKIATTDALGAGSYVVRGSIYKVGMSNPTEQGTTHPPITIA